MVRVSQRFPLSGCSLISPSLLVPPPLRNRVDLRGCDVSDRGGHPAIICLDDGQGGQNDQRSTARWRTRVDFAAICSGKPLLQPMAQVAVDHHFETLDVLTELLC